MVGQPTEHGANERELAALYALELLEGAELAEFERHFAGCKRCADIVAGDQAVTAALAVSVAPREASPGFRQRLMQRAAGEMAREPVDLNRAAPAPVKLRPRGSRLRLWAAAVAAALVLAMGGAAAGTQIYASQPLLSVALTGSATAGRATVVLQRSGAAVLHLDGMAAPPPGHVYEVWVIDAGGATPAGISADGRGSILLSQPVLGKTVAITVEPAPGGPAPTSTPILAAAVGS